MVMQIAPMCGVDDCRRAGLDVVARHKGILNFTTAIDLREHWISQKTPSRFRFLKALVSKMKTMGLVDHNPVSGIPAPAIPKRVRPEITREKWMRMVDASEGHYIQHLIKGVWMTGLAFSDLCLLEWKHIDIDAGIITKVRQKMTKRAGGECIIPLEEDGPFIKYLRKAWESKDLEANVYPSNVAKGVHYVCNEIAAQYFRTYRHSEIYRQYRLARDRAGVDAIDVHDFRSHTATVLVNSMNPILAAQVTGHTNLNVLQKYVQKDVKSLTDKVRQAHKEAA